MIIPQTSKDARRFAEDVWREDHETQFNERNTSVNLALTGLMAALVLVATMFFKVEIPVGTDKTMIGFANVFCILSGLLLGPVYGGLAAGIGSCIFDLMGGWADSAPTTLIFKFMMAFVCGLIAWAATGPQESSPA